MLFGFIIVYQALLCAAQFTEEDIEIIFDQKQCIPGSFDALFAGKTSKEVLLDKDSDTNLMTVSLKNVSTDLSQRSINNAAANLNALAQYNNIEYSYELISESGPPHSKIFKISLTLGDETYVAEASSLKKAKHNAASIALANTDYEHPPLKSIGNEKNLTPTVLLNMYTTIYGLPFSYTLITEAEETSKNGNMKLMKSREINLNNTDDMLKIPMEDAQIEGPFKVSLKVANIKFVGFGDTIQSAKHDAAKKAIKSMGQILDKDNVCKKEGYEDECKDQKENLKSPISRVHEAAQKLNQNVEFKLVEEQGAAHKRIFITHCQVGDFITEGEGGSKKVSKRNAAERMLENLIYLPQLTDNKAFHPSNKKRNKKKRVIKTYGDKLNKLIGDVKTLVWNDEKSPSLKKTPRSSIPKDDLLRVGNMLYIDIQFMDLPAGKSGKFFSLVSLDVNPSSICLGNGLSKSEASNNAALKAIKFLSRSGLLDNIKSSEFWKTSSFKDISVNYIPDEQIDS